MGLLLLVLLRGAYGLFGGEISVDGVSSFPPARIAVSFNATQPVRFYCGDFDREFAELDPDAAGVIKNNSNFTGVTSLSPELVSGSVYAGTNLQAHVSCLLEDVGSQAFQIKNAPLSVCAAQAVNDCGEYRYYSETKRRCVSRIGYLLRLTNNCNGYTRMADEWIQLAAVCQMAVNHVNTRNYSIVGNSGGSLSMVELDDNWEDVMYNDESCGASSVGAIRDAMNLGISGVLGPGRSAASTPAAIVGEALYSIPVMSWWATSVKLSNKEDFPMFARVIAPDSLAATAIVDLCRYYNWMTIATAGVDDDYGAPFMSDFLEKAALAGIRVTGTYKWAHGDAQQVEQAFNGLANSGARVFLVLIFEADMPTAWNVTKARKLFGPGYVWITTDIVQFENSLVTEMGPWLDGFIRCMARTFQDPGWSILKAQFAGLDVRPLNTSLLAYPTNLTSGPLNELAGMLYDGVWTFAFALERLLRQGNQTNQTFLTPGWRLLDSLKNTNFTGVSGPVALDENGDRKFMGVSIQNFDIRFPDAFIEVGTWSPLDGVRMFPPPASQMRWPGGLQEVPRDQAREVFNTIHVEEWAFVIVVVFCVLGLLLGLFIVVMHIKHRKLRIIKSSSPLFNVLAVSGAPFFYAFLTIWGSTGETTPAACGEMVWLLALGFTLAFGPLFIKTHRIHMIFNMKQLRQKSPTDTVLIVPLVGLLAVDILLCGIMSGVDAPYPVAVRFGLGVPSDSAPVPEFITYNQYYTCRSSGNVLIILLIVYKFVLLAYGSYLALRVRGIKDAAFNDSFRLGVSIYNTTVASALAIGLGIVDPLKEVPTVRFLVLSFLVYYVITAMFFIVFFKKLWAILTNTVEQAFPPSTHGASSTGSSLDSGVEQQALRKQGEYVQALQNQLRSHGIEPHPDPESTSIPFS